MGRLADRFRDMTGGTVIVFSAEENEDPAIVHDVRMHVDRCKELTLEDLAGDMDEETEVPERVLILWDDHLSGLDKATLDAAITFHADANNDGEGVGETEEDTGWKEAESESPQEA